MSHPADETKKSLFIHGVLPAIVAALVLVASVTADLISPGEHWFQRAGSVTTVLGAYVAYIDASRSFKFIDGSFYINHELPYRIVSVTLVVLGTLIWGYGDLLL